jgi:hypothetical protein
MSLGTSLGDRVELLGYLNAHLGVEPIKDHMGELGWVQVQGGI